MRATGRWAVLLVAVVLRMSVSMPAASAHQNGRVQLYVASFELVPVSGTYRATVALVDRDSGNPAGGFNVTVAGVDHAGHELTPVALKGADGGLYSGSFALVAGTWNLTASADQGNSTVAAVATQRTYTVEVRSDGSVVAKGGDGGGSSWPLIVGLGAGGVAVGAGVVWLRKARRVSEV